MEKYLITLYNFAVFAEYLKTFLGAVSCVSLILFVVLCIPVYLFRAIVTFLSKILRPDLDEIIGGQNAAFSADYFAKTPPRSNLVITGILNGRFTTDELKQELLKKWIGKQDELLSDNGESTFKKFQQYPTRWLGFSFWKKSSDTFSIDKHVHTMFGKDVQVTEDMLEGSVEKLLTSRFPPKQSPWEFYIVENFKYSHHSIEDRHHTAFILRTHHILADGYGLASAFLDGLAQDHRWSSTIPKVSARSVSTKTLGMLALPLNAFCELSHIISQNFRSSPLKIPDERKQWYQHVVKADPIPIQNIKDIKSAFGVSFTSVLLSVISAAIHQHLEKRRENKHGDGQTDSVFCMSMLPVPGRRPKEILTNKLAGVMFDLPTTKYDCPLDRLRAVDNVLEGKKTSMFPYLSQYYATLLGNLSYSLCKLFSRNRMVPIALTNFPGVPVNANLSGRSIVDSDFVLGGFYGETGICICSLSHHDQIRLGMVTEAGLMSRKEAEDFVKCMTDELNILRTCEEL